MSKECEHRYTVGTDNCIFCDRPRPKNIPPLDAWENLKERIEKLEKGVNINSKFQKTDRERIIKLEENQKLHSDAHDLFNYKSDKKKENSETLHPKSLVVQQRTPEPGKSKAYEMLQEANSVPKHLFFCTPINQSHCPTTIYYREEIEKLKQENEEYSQLKLKYGNIEEKMEECNQLAELSTILMKQCEELKEEFRNNRTVEANHILKIEELKKYRDTWEKSAVKWRRLVDEKEKENAELQKDKKEKEKLIDECLKKNYAKHEEIDKLEQRISETLERSLTIHDVNLNLRRYTVRWIENGINKEHRWDYQKQKLGGDKNK